MQTLEVEPLGRLSWEFRVTVVGQELTTLSLTRFRDRGAFQLDGVAHTVAAEGFLQRTYRLERGGLPVARAEARGVLRPVYAVTLVPGTDGGYWIQVAG